MLCFDPSSRITAWEALNHAYLEELSDGYKFIVFEGRQQVDFSFEEKNLGRQDIRALIQDEIITDNPHLQPIVRRSRMPLVMHRPSSHSSHSQSSPTSHSNINHQQLNPKSHSVYPTTTDDIFSAQDPRMNIKNEYLDTSQLFSTPENELPPPLEDFMLPTTIPQPLTPTNQHQLHSQSLYRPPMNTSAERSGAENQGYPQHPQADRMNSVPNPHRASQFSVARMRSHPYQRMEASNPNNTNGNHVRSHPSQQHIRSHPQQHPAHYAQNTTQSQQLHHQQHSHQQHSVPYDPSYYANSVLPDDF
jgi:hypothetical protein